MTNKERVVASLEHRQPDRTPYTIGFTQKAAAAMTARYGDSFWPLIDNALHGVGARPGPKDQWLSETLWQDEFGVQWDRSIDRDIGNVCNRVIPERNLDKLEMPDPRDPAKFEGPKGEHRGGGGEVRAVWHRVLALRAGMDDAGDGKLLHGHDRGAGVCG
ncbi:MAG: hypothetical protein ABFE08_05490 [Armatimonadia bacterium]